MCMNSNRKYRRIENKLIQICIMEIGQRHLMVECS
jgi:hypothetical protein